MNTRMPGNLTGGPAATWEALFAKADENGVVNWTPKDMPDITAESIDLLAAVTGCQFEDQPDGGKKVTLTFKDAPTESAPEPEPGQVAAAVKKTEFAATEEGEERSE
ncbi:MAG: hypothetical protein HYV90_00755 [Candidatus Woesebacteria bacterium]|nr:MAG: hypothetical protein HYV90_00755 [Candidatus Woesebacteria bacterium]